MRKVPVTEAVGMILCRDITRVIPGHEKGRAFRKGHKIGLGGRTQAAGLGKEHIYATPGMVHEDEAAQRLARCAAGPGVYWDEPRAWGSDRVYSHTDIGRLPMMYRGARKTLPDSLQSQLVKDTRRFLGAADIGAVTGETLQFTDGYPL